MEHIEWIIAVMVFAMLVYPIIQMIPSEKQKRQVALRQTAMAKGIRVQVRYPKLIQNYINEHPEILRSVAYFLPVKETSLDKKCIAVKSDTDPEGWFWLDGIRPHPSIMLEMLPLYRTMPDYCLAIEQGPHGSAIFLLDTLKTCNIEEIFTSLEELNALVITDT